MRDNISWKWGDNQCPERMAVLKGLKLFNIASDCLCGDCEEKLSRNTRFFDLLMDNPDFDEPDHQLKDDKYLNLDSATKDAIINALKANEYDDDHHDDYGGCGSSLYAVASANSHFYSKFPLADRLWRTIQMYGEDNAMKFVIPIKSNLLDISYV